MNGNELLVKLKDSKMDESKAKMILICYKGSQMLGFIDYFTNAKENLLLFAASRNHFDLASIITKHKDFTNSCCTAGLFESCKKGYYKITKLLIECGVDIRQESDACLHMVYNNIEYSLQSLVILNVWTCV
jgi:hypothetical protein